MMKFEASHLLEKPMSHHAGIEALWNEVWKDQCLEGIYPFNKYSHIEDFEPIIKMLIKKGINDAYSDEWTTTFMPALKSLEKQAREAEDAGKKDEAMILYLRGASVGMIARFPMINSSLKHEAWELQKKLYIKGTSFWAEPVNNVEIPHTHAASNDGLTVQMFVRLPSQHTQKRCPTMLYITGLDGYRTDAMFQGLDFLTSHGAVVVVVEIPGCGDSPAARKDPLSPGRFFSTVLDWIETQSWADKNRIFAWGTSTGGYYAMRIAHTHAKRLRAVIAQGGASHHAWSKQWLDDADNGEYPFVITPALMVKFGYEDLDTMKDELESKFSLLHAGLLDQPSTRLILLNGNDDTIFPIEDSYLLLQHGGIKESRFFPGLPHMGFPAVFPIMLKLFGELLGVESDAEGGKLPQSTMV